MACLILDIPIKIIILPEIPLDMSVYDGSDNEDLEVKQESIDCCEETNSVEEFPPASDSEEVVFGMVSDSQDTDVKSQLKNNTEYGKI